MKKVVITKAEILEQKDQEAFFTKKLKDAGFDMNGITHCQIDEKNGTYTYTQK